MHDKCYVSQIDDLMKVNINKNRCLGEIINKKFI